MEEYCDICGGGPDEEVGEIIEIIRMHETEPEKEIGVCQGCFESGEEFLDPEGKGYKFIRKEAKR